MSTTAETLTHHSGVRLFAMGVKLFVLGWIVQIYRLVVLTVLCYWFITPVFHVSVPLWFVAGILLIVYAVKDEASESFERDLQFEMLMTAVRACVPEDRMEEVKDAFCTLELLDPEQRQKANNIGKGAIYARAMSTTMMLGVGYVLHITVGWGHGFLAGLGLPW